VRKGREEEKTFGYKNHVSSELNVKSKKVKKKGLKKFAEVDLVATFAPAIAQMFLLILLESDLKIKRKF